MHGIPFSHSPSPEDISVFLLPNLCCASKICSWAASRAEKASPRSVEKEGGGAEEGSDQTAKGVRLKGLGGHQGLPNSRRACWRGPRLPPLPMLASVSKPLASHPGTPGAGPLQSSPPAGRDPTSFWPSLFQEQQATVWELSVKCKKDDPAAPTPWISDFAPSPVPSSKKQWPLWAPSKDLWQSTPTTKAPTPGPPYRRLFYSEQTHFSLNFILLLSLRQTHLLSKCWGTSHGLASTPSPTMQGWQGVSWNLQLLCSTSVYPLRQNPRT